MGLTVTEVKRGLRVATVLPRTPAQKAGIRPGDLIVAVDGRSIAGVLGEVSTARIKGRPGTPVELRVVSAPGGKRATSTSSGRPCTVPAAIGELKQAGGTKVAYVRFATFSEGAHADLVAVLKRLDRRARRAWCSTCGATEAGC